MAINFEPFKNFSEGVKNIVFTIAAIIAGWWAVLEFDLLHKIDKANYELEELRQKIEQKPAVQIQMENKVISNTKGGEGYHLLGTAHVNNYGNIEATLYFSESTVTAAKIVFDEHGEITYGPIMRYKLEHQLANMVYMTIMPGEAATKLPFVFFLKEPGLYSLLFQVTISKDLAVDKQAAENADRVVYAQQVFVPVGMAK